MKRYDAIIIGGGLAGLAAAWEFTRSGHHRQVLLLEAGNRLGGKIQTESVDGLTIEAGADSFLMRKPWAVELCRELGIEHRLRPTNQQVRQVYILRHGALQPLPAGLRLIVPTDPAALRASTLLSPAGCERMLAEIDVPPGPPCADESLASFVRRRFGEECLNVLAEPMLAGLFVGNADTLSMAATFPEYLEMEQKHGSLLRAAQAAPPAAPVSPNPVAGMFATLPGGMQELIDTLADQLDCRIRTNAPVLAVRRQGITWEVETAAGTYQTAKLVLATPMRAAGQLLAGAAPALSALLAAQEYVCSATVSLAFDRADAGSCRPLDGYGVIIPAIEKRSIAALSWTSTKIPERAPDDRILMRAFLGGHGAESQLDLSDEVLIDIARGEIAAITGLTSPPLFAKIYRYRAATPAFEVGHVARVNRIMALADNMPGLALCGCDYRGFGIPDTVRSAREAARRL